MTKNRENKAVENAALFVAGLVFLWVFALEGLAGIEKSAPVAGWDLGIPDLILGDPAAPLAIIEYSDFECAFCRRHYRTVFPSLMHNYIDTGKVRYVQRDFPLDGHSSAFPAAVAARCAGEQGMYWPMRKQLFEAGRLSTPVYKLAAKIVGLDEVGFARCLDSDRYDQAVQRSIDEGKRFGVRGTPFFMVGRVAGSTLTEVHTIVGAQPLSIFVRIIESLLTADRADVVGR